LKIEACAEIASGLVVDPVTCENVNGINIRVGGTAFVRALEDADVAVPVAFTATAPF